ncbi:hypothetical protein CEW46_23920 [Bacillus cereus]|nr:hypothetical protein CEW46_23920 [Bacillus cereus]
MEEIILDERERLELIRKVFDNTIVTRAYNPCLLRVVSYNITKISRKTLTSTETIVEIYAEGKATKVFGTAYQYKFFLGVWLPVDVYEEALAKGDVFDAFSPNITRVYGQTVQ